MKQFCIALYQNAPQRDVDSTVQSVLSVISRAAGSGADIVALPELFYYPYETAAIKKIGDMHRLLDQFKECALANNVYICTGSMAIAGPTGLRNTAYLLGPQGEELLSYSKCHLFDVNTKDVHVNESSVFVPGDRASVVTTPIGTIGILICYDIRFPEMARHLTLLGAELIIVPAVFGEVTGAAHWHLMLRARAVENQVYCAGISQARVADSPYKAYGHSMVVSPWGDVLTEAGSDEEVLYADCDHRVLDETRKRLPLLQHRRSHLYDSLHDACTGAVY